MPVDTPMLSNMNTRSSVITLPLAPGAKGQLALTLDGGASWKVANVSTSADLADTSWVSNDHGWALVSGAVLFTEDGGASWTQVSRSPATVILPPADPMLVGDCAQLAGESIPLAQKPR